MILDVTTKNRVYNTVGPQAQWYRHRWGKRDYPDLDLRLSDIPDNPIYHLTCMYGDPADWKHIDKFLKVTDRTLFIDSYGMFKKSTLQLLTESSLGFINIRVDGWNNTMGKVFLGQKLNSVKKSISALNSKVKLEYRLYRHNLSDLTEFKEFCDNSDIEYSVLPGELTDDGLSCIVSPVGEWLYDIHSASEELQLGYAPEQLHKTALGAERLKTYISDPLGRRITEYPMIPNITNLTVTQEIKDKYTEESSTFVSCTGHVFDNVQLGQLFMLLLAPDWKFSILDLPKLNDYEKSILYGASVLSAMVQ